MSGFLGPSSILAGSFVVYLIYSALSRVFFHPLRNFPGPKIAALTGWYTTYYDLFKDGGLVDHLEALHRVYGPVLRIGPNELHFSDPRAFAGIYGTGSKFLKDPNYYECFARGKESLFVSWDPQKVKIRRDALNPLFSRRAILKLESVVQDKVDIFLRALLQYQANGQSANIELAFHSLSFDIITSYCFGHCYDALAAPDFQHPVLVGLKASLPLSSFFRHFPVLKHIVRIPDWFGEGLFGRSKVTQGFVVLQKNLGGQIDTLLKDPTLLEIAEHETIFHHLITPAKDEHQILSRETLIDEGVNLMFAGSDTVANTCKIGSFYVLNDRTVYTRLVKELDEAWPDKESKMKLETLEKLPYLTAVIKESLRMVYGVVSPFARIVGPNTATIVGTDVPKGTIVSMSTTFVHNNADIFPDPFTFSPDRWLQPNSNELDPYLVSFSKGPRSCIGINLAWCELYLIFANLFRMAEMVIDKTTVDDLKFRAYFLPVYRGRPLRVFVKNRAT